MLVYLYLAISWQSRIEAGVACPEKAGAQRPFCEVSVGILAMNLVVQASWSDRAGCFRSIVTAADSRQHPVSVNQRL